MKALILAAGQGRRLGPVSDLIPKPLLPLGGRPILAGLLENLAALGIAQAAIVVGHKAQMIRRFIGDGRRFGVRVTYFDQTEAKGTAHAVAQAASFIDDEIMVLAGDTAFEPAHLRGLMDFHAEQGADVSLCLKRLGPERLAAASSVELASGGRVVRMVEKPNPATAPSDLAVALLHIYPRTVADYAARTTLSPRGEHELTEVINLMIAEGLRVFGREFPAPQDLSDLKDLLGANFPYLADLLAQFP